MVYSYYKFFPSIKDEDKIKFNKFMSRILFCSYPLDLKSGTYLGPVDFTRRFFAELKDDLPGYAKRILLDNQAELPERLKVFEDNLDDMEKFELGYYNEYIGVLELLANGKEESTNIFEDLPGLYLKYCDKIKDNYPAYNSESNKKTY